MSKPDVTYAEAYFRPAVKVETVRLVRDARAHAWRSQALGHWGWESGSCNGQGRWRLVVINWALNSALLKCVVGNHCHAAWSAYCISLTA